MHAIAIAIALAHAHGLTRNIKFWGLICEPCYRGSNSSSQLRPKGSQFGHDYRHIESSRGAMGSRGADMAEPPNQIFDTLLCYDFGSQYSHLITRRLRDLNIYCELQPCTTKLSDIPFKPKGIILSGGPYSVYDENAPHVDPKIFDLGVPVLGICYGLQEIAWIHGKKTVSADEKREYGNATLNIVRHAGEAAHTDKLLDRLGDCLEIYMSHGDKLASLPAAFKTIATTSSAPYAGIAHHEMPIYGIQWHPEVTHSAQGSELLRNFAVDICHARQHWTMNEFAGNEIARIRALVGEEGQVIGAVSGGVDSTVAAKLMNEAIGNRFHAVLVDNGLLRLNEAKTVHETLTKHLGINLTVVDARDLFLASLKGETDPEKKRKSIGANFIKVFQDTARKIEAKAARSPQAGDIEWLLQGTLYPDVIESISFKGPSQTIKSHHNVGGLPKEMNLKLIEPLRELFKDEVRVLGARLGIPEDLVWRHPFPGPGLAIRVLEEVTEERLELARQADHIFIEEIKKAGVYNKISQAYVAITLTKAVGVQGDQRVYGYLAVLRAVETTDFMTADVYYFDKAFLKRVSSRITNEIQGISRVAFDLTSKPPGTIEME